MRAIVLGGFFLLAGCPSAVCGNGVVDTGEACDDANADPADGCDLDCTVNQCGDGVPQPGELCLSPRGGFAVQGDDPDLLRAGDLDGDGDLDLLAASDGSDQVSVLLNDGAGAFPALRISTVAEGLRDAILLDIDNNGTLDAIFAQTDGSSLQVARGAGDGTFSSVQALDPGLSPVFVRAADVTGDGLLDVVSDGVDLDSAARLLSVLPGNGDGTFGAPLLTTLAEIPFGMVLRDFDNDGAVDALLSFPNDDRVQVFRNQGDGTFFGLQFTTTGEQPERIELADIDGDAIDDLFVANRGSREITVHKGEGTGDFSAPVRFDVVEPPERLAVGELSGDAFADLIVGVPSRMKLHLGVPGLPFVLSQELLTARPPQDLLLADLDGDGQADLASSQDTEDAAVSPSQVNVFLSRP